MAFKIVITLAARRDVQQAIDWENERIPGLGERFFEDLQLKLIKLSDIPFIGGIRYDDVRCTTTDVFQYLIHYRVNTENEKLLVLRVLHVRKKPIW